MAAGDGYHPWSQMFDKQQHEERHDSASRILEAMKARAGKFVSMLDLDETRPYGRNSALRGLRAITLPELEPGEVHYGRVLYGRLSAKAFKMAAVHTVLEDEIGRGVRLSVYDAVSPMASAEEIETLFPVGMKVAIKEPYFKWALDGQTVVRVDDPTDVVRIPDNEGNDSKLETEEARMIKFLQGLRQEGNRLFREEDWSGAGYQYTLCITAVVKEEESLEGLSENLKDVIKLAYSNRAETFLRENEFEMAFYDATRALEVDPTHLKSLSRKGRAAMELELYMMASEAFAAVLERCPDEPSARENLTLCRRKLGLDRLENQCKESVNSSRKYPDYVGPVEIRRVAYGDGRRGLFAKESIKAHTVFLVSNAMAVVTKQPGGDRAIFDMSSSSIDSSDSSSDTCSLARDHDALVQLLERATTSTRNKAQLYSLATAGKEEMEVPSMELFKPGSEWAPSSASTLKVDVSLIKEIVRLNSFSSGHSDISSTGENDGKDELTTAGLWILPSFMNHSCVPNCIHVSIGDVKFVRTARDIKLGEELTISYFNVLFAGVEDRARKLSFKCTCERCLLEKQLGAEISQINTRVGVLVLRSRQEFADGHSRFQATKVFDKRSVEVADLFGSLNMVAPELNTHRNLKKLARTGSTASARAGSTESCHVDKKYLATRELVDLADRAEALLGSMDMEIAPHQQGWIRAGILEAYLAKYQLAMMRETDGSARIHTLNLIMDSMMSVLATDSTQTVAHLLLHEVKARYNKKSKTYRTAKDHILRVLRSLYGNELSGKTWSDLTSTDLEFDYCSFSFNIEPTTLKLPSFL